jgi:hypothetical protein
MEIVMTKNASDTATATGLSGPPTAERSVLDRRRNKLQVAKAYAASAVSDFRRLDEQLASNDDQRREQEASLQAALDRVVLLKKAIKASIKEADKLRAAREDAGKRATEAQQRVTAAEARYDRAVLADMVRREKENDLAAHAGTGDMLGAHTRVLSTRGSSTMGDSEGSDMAADAARHAPDQSLAAAAGTDTARVTAARQTAARAHTAIAVPESGLPEETEGTT